MVRAPAETVILRRSDVAAALCMPDCIDAVERAFLRHASGSAIPPGVLGTHVTDGGFHVKSAGLLDALDGHSVFAAKINANFPGNRTVYGLPTIQGVIALFDAGNGRLLALLDSIEITTLRTAATTAVAAKYLAPPDGSVTIVGCGEQGRSHLRALACVRSIDRASVFDIDAERATRLACEMTKELDVDVSVIRSLDDAPSDTRVWVTCTPSRRWVLGRAHVAPGSFVAAVGADNPEKQEIEPELLASSAVVADVLEQCASIGDLRHAIAAGVMRREDVRAELADVVARRTSVRRSRDEVVVFDSTGTALEDVAVATLAYERARSSDVGLVVDLGGLENAT